jgi:type II secretory pathway component PulL
VTLLEQKPVAPLPSLAKVPPPAPEQNRQQQPGLTFGGLFGEVTQKRAPDDWQGLLLSGTQGASDFWQKPWLFARVILGLGGAFLVTLILSGIFEQYSYGAQILPLMALALPLTICLFFWEANRERDISLLS